jgi:hypothetical protein
MAFVGESDFLYSRDIEQRGILMRQQNPSHIRLAVAPTHMLSCELVATGYFTIATFLITETPAAATWTK